MTTTHDPKLTCTLELHGAAATSSPHSLITTSDESIIYASNCILNIAKPIQRKDHNNNNNNNNNNGKKENEYNLYNVNTTLRTRTIPREKDCISRSITTLSLLKPLTNDDDNYDNEGGDMGILNNILVCAFSDGTLTLWKQVRNINENDNNSDYSWVEDVIVGVTEDDGVRKEYEGLCSDSVTDVDGVYKIVPSSSSSDDDELIRIQVILVTSSSKGVNSYRCTTSIFKDTSKPSTALIETKTKIASYPTASLKLTTEMKNQIILSIGTAQPRNNRVHFYSLTLLTQDNNNNIIMTQDWMYQGSLLGHLGWVTCLDWLKNGDHMLLASGSYDCRIRLWKFHAPLICETDGGLEQGDTSIQDLDVMDDGEDDKDDDVDLVEEGEARMNIRFLGENGIMMQSAVTLEALLIGHEEQVTSVAWRPQSNAPSLISSSMDRSILIWKEENDYTNNDSIEIDGVGNVWAPVTRVGTAGGILGGSIGSSLLGFVNVIWNSRGNQIIGHGYGGSIYFWSCRKEKQDGSYVERWRANPCITGHFRGCSDISWEVSEGLYLLSAGLDQTCRLWTYLPSSPFETEDRIWREVGRPQVHGYDLNAVACIGSGDGEMKHRFVSGADEKEARTFDAPVSTLKLLSLLHGKTLQDSAERVERAFIPSLGLSNRATADDAMEEDSFENTGTDNLNSSAYEAISGNLKLNFETMINLLPHERDLGVVSLWPEIRKLYGHQTELVCLASNIGRYPHNVKLEVLASSCKARDSENASIRLWDVDRNMCLGTLKDGHKSTVTTMSFSIDGKFIASSGKDRRLCLWKKRDTSSEGLNFDLSLMVESAHKRIVWSLDFCPHDPSIICTGSRDGFLKLWHISDSLDEVSINELIRWEPSNKGNKKVEPITAVAFAPTMYESFAVLAIGLESGRIEIWGIPLDLKDSKISCQLLHLVPLADCHIEAVKKLAWQPPQINRNSSNIWDCTLASCSADHGVRIYRFKQCFEQ